MKADTASLFMLTSLQGRRLAKEREQLAGCQAELQLRQAAADDQARLTAHAEAAAGACATRLDDGLRSGLYGEAVVSHLHALQLRKAALAAAGRQCTQALHDVQRAETRLQNARHRLARAQARHDKLEHLAQQRAAADRRVRAHRDAQRSEDDFLHRPGPLHHSVMPRASGRRDGR
jgi:hypothetical protein